MESISLMKKALDTVFDTYADETLFVYLLDDGTEKCWSYSDVRKELRSIEALMHDIGAVHHERVALIMPHSPYAIMAGVGLVYAGVTIVLIDAGLPVDEIERLLLLSDVSAVFTIPEVMNLFQDSVLLSHPCFCLNPDGHFDLSRSKVTSLRSCETPDWEDDVMAILFSSGTTAQMKGIKHTYHTILDSLEIYRKLSGIKPRAKYLIVLPFNHIAGFTGAFQYIFLGAKLALIENVNASKLSDAFQRFRPEFFAMVPKVYEVIRDRIETSVCEKGLFMSALFHWMMRFSGYMRKTFGLNIGKSLFRGINRQVFGGEMTGLGVGSSPCKAEISTYFLNLGYNWANFYSSTETGVPAVATGINDRYPAGIVGNIHQFEDIQVRIDNPDCHGIGEICIKSPLCMKGYFRDPLLTKEAFDSDGFIRTGDLGSIDDHGNLYITGRQKEIILLHNGKKVSPIDVEELYRVHLSKFHYACCGIPDTDGFDQVHLFVEKSSGLSDSSIRDRVYRASAKISGLYHISGVHVIDQIPMTNVGKVKRGILKQYLMDDPKAKKASAKKKADTNTNVHEQVRLTISELTNMDVCEIHEDHLLEQDLGIDSLTMFELCSELENHYNISIASGLKDVRTVGDLIALVRNPSHSAGTVFTYDINDFPAPQTPQTISRLKRYMKFSSFIWDIEAEGLENLPLTGNYILAPNHESHLDGLWVWTALSRHQPLDLSKICCMAKEEHLQHRYSKNFMGMLGGIPVERSENTARALGKCEECLKEGYHLLIHPEGTRTKTGQLGPLKNGVIRLARRTGVPIVPVRITGAREIYPPDRKLPRGYDLLHFRKRKLQITFFPPIDVKELTEEESIDRIRVQIGGLSGRGIQ